MNKKLVSFTLSALLALPFLASAAFTINDKTYNNPAEWIAFIINNLLNFIVWPIFFALSVVMFIFAGFMYLSAHGEPGKIQAANKAVIWAVVGIIVAIIGFSITNIITKVIFGTP